MSELDDLFSRLKGQQQAQAAQQAPSGPASQAHLSQQPAVSSPIFSPPSHTPNPIHSSNVISPVNPSSMTGTPAPVDQSKTTNLLNLLRSSSNAAHSSTSAGPMASLQNVGRTPSGSLEGLTAPYRDDSRPMSAHDFVASLQRSRPSSEAPTSRGATAGAEKADLARPSSHDSKQFLLDLLKKPSATTAASTTAKPAEPSKPADVSVEQLTKGFATTSIEPPVLPRSQREPTPVRQFGSPVIGETTFEAPQPSKSTQFDYNNPFTALHASSPLNRAPKPQVPQAEPKKMEILKHDRDVSSALNGESVAPATKSRKIEGVVGSPSPVRAEAEKGQSVSEALEDVGEKVDKQVEEALKQADGPADNTVVRQSTEAPPLDTLPDLDATQVKQEPTADNGIESSWESAEDDEAGKAGQDFQVQVFNFPMRAFASIHVKPLPNTLPVRPESLTLIARLKKEFDQADRNLVTASQAHILYAPPSNKKTTHPGLRIIQQEFGQHKHIFTSTSERLFNVQLCTSPYAGGDIETVLGTGVNGTVFWTSLSKSRGELFEDDDVEGQGFIMPAVTTVEEQTSGSPVKTRAKVASRHTDVFGVARGKMIHIIAPDVVKDRQYFDAKTRVVNSEKYLAERGLRIMTGKAGKDFCFSEDDSVIVSLDKSGRFKFWDIRELTTRAADIMETAHDPVELREPILSLTAAASGSKPEDKPSVSSIMFLDKEKPTLKGAPMRYMLIGFKQNHILQLWDLGLGKAVQELRLPHEKDSDGICSITYHPRTGIIAVGHPTRNSIFFVHLSAPMYKLPNVNQAVYISGLARNDSTFPTPSSTAIMSGIRELSFAKVGQLRSLDMLRTPAEHAPDVDTEDAPLFELYVMHSKGVVGIGIKKKDLGWDKEQKNMNPVDASDAGVIEVLPLLAPEKMQAPSEQSSVADAASVRSAKGAANKKQEAAKAPPAPSAKGETVKKAATPSPSKEAFGSSTPVGASKQIPEALLPSQTPAEATNPPLLTPATYAMAAQRVKSPSQAEPAQQPDADRSMSDDNVLAPRVSSDGDLQAMMTKQFDSLYQRIDGDKRVLDAASSAKQEAVLRLISSTLSENVEQSLHRIVGSSIEKEVLPAITNVTTKAVEKKLVDLIPQQVSTAVAREVKGALPHALQQALKDTHVQRAISEQVANKVQQQVSTLLQQSLPGMATQATQKMVADLDKATKAQMRVLETRRVEDMSKINELSEMLRGMTEAISKLSQSQAAFEERSLKFMQENVTSGATTAPVEAVEEPAAEPPAEPVDPQREAEEAEVAKITQLLVDGKYDDATIEVIHPNPLQLTPHPLIHILVAPIHPPSRALRPHLRTRQSALPRASVAPRRPLRQRRYHRFLRDARRLPPRLAIRRAGQHQHGG